MGSLAVILSLCTVAAVGIVYFLTDSLLISFLILAAGLALAFYLDYRWRLDEAKHKLTVMDGEEKAKIREDLGKLQSFKSYAELQKNLAVAEAVDHIYEVSQHILHDKGMDLKFINEVGLYLPRINKILDAYCLKGADAVFRNQAQEFMVRTSEVFGRMLTATGSGDRKEAESIMKALDETYRRHGHIDEKDRGGLS